MPSISPISILTGAASMGRLDLREADAVFGPPRTELSTSEAADDGDGSGHATRGRQGRSGGMIVTTAKTAPTNPPATLGSAPAPKRTIASGTVGRFDRPYVNLRIESADGQHFLQCEVAQITCQALTVLTRRRPPAGRAWLQLPDHERRQEVRIGRLPAVADRRLVEDLDLGRLAVDE